MALLHGMAALLVADATLRAVGGSPVTVLAAMPVNDQGNSGLGMGTAMQQEWELEPVLVRWKTANDGKHRELVVSAATLERAFNTCDTETLRSILLRSQVNPGGEKLRITDVSTELYEGTVYLYRARLER